MSEYVPPISDEDLADMERSAVTLGKGGRMVLDADRVQQLTAEIRALRGAR